MKLVNDLMFKFYKAQLDYYDEKSDRLNDKAKQLWSDGKDYHDMENRSMYAAAKAADAFEHCYRWSDASKNGLEFTMESRSGGVHRIY